MLQLNNMNDAVKRYNPNRSNDWNYGGKNWKLSRSKIELFCECPRCFYLDNKLGTSRPRGPSFTLNIAVDELYKREFDVYRKQQLPHPIMLQNNLDAVPFAHKDLDLWRDNFTGITWHNKETGFTVSGAIDDVWQKPDDTLIIVDYKATAKAGTISTLSDSSWESSYRRQMGVYQWLFRQNGFSVDETGYFVYANAQYGEKIESFNNQLQFETTLVPCQGDTDWINDTITQIANVLQSDELPASAVTCEYCQYRETSAKKLQAIFFAQHGKK
jgi:hypothetical protein